MTQNSVITVIINLSLMCREALGAWECGGPAAHRNNTGLLMTRLSPSWGGLYFCPQGGAFAQKGLPCGDREMRPRLAPS